MKFENAPSLSPQNQLNKPENEPIQSIQNQTENSENKENSNINWMIKNNLKRLFTAGLITLSMFEAASAQRSNPFGHLQSDYIRGQREKMLYESKVKAEENQMKDFENEVKDKETSIHYNDAVKLINETKEKLLKYDQLPQKLGVLKPIKKVEENSEAKSSSLKVGNLKFTTDSGKNTKCVINGIDWAEKDTKGIKRTIALNEVNNSVSSKMVELFDFHGDTLDIYKINFDKDRNGIKHAVSFESMLTDPKYKGAGDSWKMTRVLKKITPGSSWENIKKCLKEFNVIIKDLDKKIDKKLP